MKFQVKTGSIVREKTQCVIVPIFEGGKLSISATEVDKACAGVIQNMIKRKEISGKVAETFLLPVIHGCGAQRLLLIGCGKQAPVSASVFQQLVRKLASTLAQHPISDALLCMDELNVENRDSQWQARVIAQTFAQAGYRFDQHKSKKENPEHSLKTLTIHLINKSSITAYQKECEIGAALASGIHLAKDLGNAPGNVCTPNYLANQARSLAKQTSKLTCKILEEKQMRALKMGALLSVTAGTDQPAKLIVLDYKGGKAGQAPHVLVGKGITFDSGGISLKPGAAMDEMKYDMCGAASVFGALKTITTLKLPINVVGIIAAAENMPSGGATKPGDIVTSMSGQTIEILNTDAEGRLVLCDALTYAGRYKPQSIIDIATLTGACVVALGNHAHGLYSNQDDFAHELLEAGIQANDRGWHMPLWEEYDKQLKSPFADMANIGGPNGGSVTAACFLARFTKNMRWAHLDIAGTAWNKSPKGATGRPVSLLVQYLINQAQATNKTPAAKKVRSRKK